MTVRAQNPALNVIEVAEKLRVGKDQVRALIDSGLLAGFNIALNGKPNWRVMPEAVDRFVEQQRPVINV